MKPQLQPWHLLVLILAGWINRKQQDAVEYLLAENRILREKLGKIRILLNDDQRRRLAVKGKILGRRMLEQPASIVTPETIDSADSRSRIRSSSAENPVLSLRHVLKRRAFEYSRSFLPHGFRTDTVGPTSTPAAPC